MFQAKSVLLITARSSMLPAYYPGSSVSEKIGSLKITALSRTSSFVAELLHPMLYVRYRWTPPSRFFVLVRGSRRQNPPFS